MLARASLWLIVVVGVGSSTATAIGVDGRRDARDQSGDRIEELRRELGQPGPEARERREAAVEALLLMEDRRAHDVLCEVLTQHGEDPDGVRSYVLGSLARKWRQSHDPVFGVDSSVRAELHRLYVTTLVREFDGEPPVAENGPRAAAQRLIWECLRSLSIADRKRVFESLVETRDPALLQATLFAMAGCRDLGLAPLIARSLEAGGAQTGAARAALTVLTFVERPFRDREGFERWYEANRDRSYVELAEDAARRLNRESQRRVRALEAELVGALAASENVEWKRLGEILQSAVHSDERTVYLERLRDVLARKQTLGGLAEDRRALVRSLATELDARIPNAELAVRLEVLARLVVAGEPEYAGVLERLVAAADNPVLEVRAAALRGLANHYSADNRRIVVAAGRRALAAGELGILDAVMACLARRSWVAPGPEPAQDVAEWLALLDAALRPDGVPLRFKELAIQVLIQPTADKTRVPEAFDLLLDVARAERGLAVAVRKQALIRLRVFTDDEARADRYLEVVTQLLTDAEPEMRQSAANMLREPPAASRNKRDEWIARIVASVGARLAVETEEAPLRAAFDCLMQLAGGPEDPTNVIGKFTAAVEAYLAREPAARHQFQRDVLIDGLFRLGGVQGRPPAQWTRAASGLARLEERQALRSVLERQRVATLAGQDGEAAAAAFSLVIDAALLPPNPPQTWRERPVEAEEVRLAFDELERLGRSPDEPHHRALRVLVLAALDRHEQVVARGTAILADQARPLDAADRLEVALALAGAHLAQRQLGEAAAVLDGLAETDVEALRALRVELARQHLERAEFARAEQIMARVLAGISDDAGSFPECFLVAAEARYRLAPKANRDAVLAELRAKSAVFERESTAEPTRARWAELVAEIERAGDS